MAKPNEAAQAAAKPPAQAAGKSKPNEAAQAKSAVITYVPGREDPVQVTWGKTVFEANKPKTVIDQRIIDRAKTNPWFKVEGEKQADKGFDPGTDKPENASQYRAYAITWFKLVNKSADLEQRWADEEQLRLDCEVGTDDLEYVARYYDPRLEELRKMEAAGDAQ